MSYVMHQGVREGRRKESTSSGGVGVVSLVDEAIELKCKKITSNPRCGEILTALKPLIDGNEIIVEEPYGLGYIDLDRDGLRWFARVKNEPGKWADVRVEDREVETFPSSEFYDRLREALGDGLIIVRRNKVIQVYYDETPGSTIMWIEEYPPPY